MRLEKEKMVATQQWLLRKKNLIFRQQRSQELIPNAHFLETALGKHSIWGDRSIWKKIYQMEKIRTYNDANFIQCKKQFQNKFVPKICRLMRTCGQSEKNVKEFLVSISNDIILRAFN